MKMCIENVGWLPVNLKTIAREGDVEVGGKFVRQPDLEYSTNPLLRDTIDRSTNLTAHLYSFPDFPTLSTLIFGRAQVSGN